MRRIQMKSSALLCPFVLFGLLLATIPQTSSSVIFSTITSRASSSSSSKSSLSLITSNYYGYLYSSGSTFRRPYDSSSSSYYRYQAIQVRVDTAGSYTLTSSSTMDTYGCLYDQAFHPSNPYSNLLTCDDDGGSQSGQFLIDRYFEYARTYILVVTTYRPSTTGSYTAMATGPGMASMVLILPSNDPISAAGIVGITIGCVAFFVFLVVILVACRRRQQTFVRQSIVPAQYNANAQNVYHPGFHGNAAQGPPPAYNPYSPYPRQ